MRIHLAVLALGLAVPAHADTIYRCVNKAGAVSLQSHPCPSGSKTSQQREYYRVGDDPSVAARSREISREMDRRRQQARQPVPYGYSGYAAPSASQMKDSRCSAAKARRDAVLKQAGLARNFDLLRRLDDQVYEACK